ncbi:MAG: type II toxin-antitoxin system VapC family toxin [Elusimicrobia bacterium]|nr:type II toxin-antitoxin system VapC family toxin [Elusimicrobiota bacterium]
MKRVFVDTSGWIAYFQNNEPAHAEMRIVVDQWRGRLVTTDYVFDETLILALRRLGHQAAVEIGEALLDHGQVEMVRLLPEDFEDAWELFRKQKDKKWSFTDCSSFAVMRRLRLSAAVATDRHFRQAGFETLPGA